MKKYNVREKRQRRKAKLQRKKERIRELIQQKARQHKN